MSEPGSIKLIQDLFLRELSDQVAGLGFTLRKADQAYVHETDTAIWIVHVGFIRHRSDVDATMDLGVRLNAVERLLRSAGYGSKHSVTVGGELGNIVDGRPRRWTLKDTPDCAVAAGAMFEEFSKFGISWLNRFSSAEFVFKTLATHDRMSLLYSPVHVKRCLTLVALAKILGPPGHAEATAHESRSFLESRNDPQIQVFDEHVSKLIAA